MPPKVCRLKASEDKVTPALRSCDADKKNFTYLLFEDGVKSSYFIAFGVNEGSLRFTGDHISGLLGKRQ